jgi:hypothetical protein
MESKIQSMFLSNRRLNFTEPGPPSSGSMATYGYISASIHPEADTQATQRQTI